MKNLLGGLVLGLALALVHCFEAPTLVVQSPTHQESITVRQGDSVRLQCRGRQPISWTYPTAAYDQGRLELSDRYSIRRRTHISHLVLENSTAEDTGFYGCRHEEDGQVSEVSSLYIFISGSDSLFAANNTLRFVGVGPRRANIIPCTVTNPSAQVSLKKVDDGAEIDLTRGDVVYDPRVGFSLLYPNVYYNGQFECEATLRGETERRQFIVHYLAITTMMPKPYITVSDPLLEEGTPLELRCRTLISSDTLMTVQWTKDGEPLESTDRLSVTPAVKHTFDHEELRYAYTYAEVLRDITVPCLRMFDSGVYRCTVRDHNGHTSSKSVRIRVREGNLNDANVRCLQP